MMNASLFLEARIWTTNWRRRLASLRFADVKDNLVFAAMLGVPVLVVGGIVCFACWHETETRTVPDDLADIRAEVAQRQVARAQRRENELQCLAENIYFEARGEPLAGQQAVAEVTLNRTVAPHFPHTICAVVHEKRWDASRRRVVADFSWTELGDLSPGDGPAWKRAKEVANAEYDDLRDPVVPGALFYHATSIQPSWAKGRKAVATIGNHIFYR
jgi:spore germination cell wall hydrolase CwlJ-like protein